MNKLENMLRYYGKQISKYIEKNFKKIIKIIDITK